MPVLHMQSDQSHTNANEITKPELLLHTARDPGRKSASMLIWNKCLCCLKRYHGMSAVINTQLTAPGWQKDINALSVRVLQLQGPGDRTSWISNTVCLLWAHKNDLKVACRRKNNQPWFLFFCQLLPGQLKRRKNEKNGLEIQVWGAGWMWPVCKAEPFHPQQTQPQEQLWKKIQTPPP